MSDLVFRTEELTNNQIAELYVASDYEQSIIDKLKAPSPVLLIGSRGVGKSFLFKMSEIQMLQEFSEKKILPVFLTFRKASLLKTSNPEQFQNWMLSRICSEVLRALKKTGKLSPISGGLSLLAGEVSVESSKIDDIATAFEESWKTPGELIDVAKIPTLDDFINTIEDLCGELEISRIVLFIDEAAHVFLPQQQREFFTLFRDLRSPYIKCNAAVYPGVTVYGETFEPIHDAVKVSLVRNVNDSTTAYFWVHNNAPQEVKESLRILEYSGLVYEDAAGIRATRSEIGTRYMVNLGCLLASEATPTASGMKIIKASDIRRMSEYGANYPIYREIQGKVIESETDVLKEQLKKSIDLLELTGWQKQKMHEISINTIGDLISAPEGKLKQAKYIADVRARTIKNAGIAAVCEYLLG